MEILTPSLQTQFFEFCALVGEFADHIKNNSITMSLTLCFVKFHKALNIIR